MKKLTALLLCLLLVGVVFAQDGPFEWPDAEEGETPPAEPPAQPVQFNPFAAIQQLMERGSTPEQGEVPLPGFTGVYYYYDDAGATGYGPALPDGSTPISEALYEWIQNNDAQHFTQQIPVTDAQGNPVLDSQGNPVTQTVVMWGSIDAEDEDDQSGVFVFEVPKTDDVPVTGGPVYSYGANAEAGTFFMNEHDRTTGVLTGRMERTDQFLYFGRQARATVTYDWVEGREGVRPYLSLTVGLTDKEGNRFPMVVSDEVTAYTRELRVNGRGQFVDAQGNPLTGELKSRAEDLCASMPGCQNRVNNYVIANSGCKFEYILDALSTGQILGALLAGYQKYKGVMYLTNLLFGITNEEVQRRKQELSENFCIIGRLSRCITSAVCDQFVDKPSGQATLLTLDLLDVPTVGATVKGYKVGPINIKNISRSGLRDLINQDVVYIGKLSYDLTDASTVLPDVEMFFYLVQYSVTNPGGGDGSPSADRYGAEALRKFNIEFRGARAAKWFTPYKNLSVGTTDAGMLQKYSFTDYDEVCWTVDPPFTIRSTGRDGFTFSGWSGLGFHGGGFGGRDTYGEMCDSFTSYAGLPTVVTSDTSDAVPPTAAGTAPGANV